MQTVDKLEMHVAHGCNLSCESCSHYSNHQHKGILGLGEAEAWLSAWKTRLAPRGFILLGGEPTIHPRLGEFVGLVRRAWPETHIQIITNGWFLHRHPDLPARLATAGNASLLISVHHDSPEYREKLEPIAALTRQWVRDHGIKVESEQAYARWSRRYKGYGAAMEPHEDGAPERSWTQCAARYTPQLHEGMLWKCAPLAYLGLQHRKVGLSDKWAPYLQYRPLAPDCSDEELTAFLGRGAESYCGMCPALPEHFDLPSPLPKRKSARPPPPKPATPRSPGESMQTSDQPALLPSMTRPLPIPLPEDPRSGWRPYPILRGKIANASAFGCHASALSAGVMPHTPHQHPEEELLIVLDGEADLVIRPGTEPAKRFRGRPGVFVYYPAFVAHTIHNVSRAPVSYLMMKWQSDGSPGGKALRTHIAQYPFPAGDIGKAARRSFMTRPLIEGPTRYLEKLHCHLTVLQPGAGYPPHADAYDITIVLLSGAVETLGRRVEPHGVIHYAAGEPHGMRSLGPGPAVYLVFEFHGRRAADATVGLAPAAAG